MNTAHNFTGVLKAKGVFTYCKKCGIIRLNNRATEKAINKPCGGARELEDEEYVKLRGVKYGKS